jgi:branched-subunit amino acid aminotransferase/4-amino-4-deoxychorismate lyase
MIWYANGSYIESNKAVRNINTPGFFFGYGVFTTLKIQDKRILFLKEHLTRLKSSCDYFQVTFPEPDYEKLLNQLLIANNVDDLRIKIIIQKGQSGQSELTITAEPLVLLSSPLKLTLADIPRVDCILARYKTTNYILPILNKQKATEAGFDDMLFFNQKGAVLESCFANIFFVRNRYIYTPPTELSILPGVIRGELLRSKELDGYYFAEKQIGIEEISEYESAFLTNSIQHFREISTLDGHEYKPLSAELKELLTRILNR